MDAKTDDSNHSHHEGHNHHHHGDGHDSAWSMNSSMVWGAFMLVIGVWWLLGEIGVLPFEWSWAGPIGLIAVGASMIMRQRARNRDGCC